MIFQREGEKKHGVLAHLVELIHDADATKSQ